MTIFPPITLRKKSAPRRAGERGQGLTEYAIIVALVMLLLFVPVPFDRDGRTPVGVFMGSLGDFYMNIVKVATLPIP
jgi:hypothetical protein